MTLGQPELAADRHRRLTPAAAWSDAGACRPRSGELWEQVAATAMPLRPAPPPADAPPETAPTRPAPGPPPTAGRVPARSAAPGRRRPPRPTSISPPTRTPRSTARPAADGPPPLRAAAPRPARAGSAARPARHDPGAAHAALTGFVLDAHARDLRLLLVITGKGRSRTPAAGRSATGCCATACRTGWRRRRSPAGSCRWRRRTSATAARRILRLFAPRCRVKLPDY